MYTSCIFDLDGTLLDTIQDITDAINTVLAPEHSIPYTVEQVRGMVGHGVRHLICEATSGMANADPDSVLKAYQAFYSRNCTNKTKPYAGITELLTELCKININLMVLSNKPESEVTRTIKHYFSDINFLSVAGGRPDMALKPDPAAVNELLSRFSLNPEHTLFIGDSNVDIQTAKNAKLTSVGVAWGYRGRDELEKAGADYIIDNASELLKIISI